MNHFKLFKTHLPGLEEGRFSDNFLILNPLWDKFHSSDDAMIALALISGGGLAMLTDRVLHFAFPLYIMNPLMRLTVVMLACVMFFAFIQLTILGFSRFSPEAFEQEVIKRRQAEKKLKQLTLQMEQLVNERTAEHTGVLRDRLRQVESANQELQTFGYSVAHDLQAPLRKISSFGNLIRKYHGNELGEELRTYLIRMMDNASQMSALIEALLSFSKSNLGEIRRSNVDLSAIAREIANDLLTLYPDRQVDFQIQNHLTAEGDPVLLQSVLQNLLGNAWKYSAKKSSAIIQFGMEEHSGQRRFFVRDNGAGFADNGASSIFEPFKRLHAKSEFMGSGIGLANVQRIISRHGGQVSAEGKLNEGAVIYFTLPQSD